MFHLLVATFTALLIWCIDGSVPPSSTHVEMERIKLREDYVLSGPWSNKNYQHEVTIAIKHLHLDTLEELVLQKSTPGNPSYQKWMTYEEIGDLTTNMPAYVAVKTWLTMNRLKISFTSKRHEFIKVKGSIAQWERLLRTDFHAFHKNPEFQTHRKHSSKKMSSSTNTRTRAQFSTTAVEASHSIPRAHTYYLPDDIAPHIHAIFHVSHLPPRINHHGITKRVPVSVQAASLGQQEQLLEKQPSRQLQSSTVASTIQFLQHYYDVNVSDTVCPSDPTIRQSVFETAKQGMSQSDLSDFQALYGTMHPGLEATIFDASGDLNGIVCDPDEGNCDEGNLDIQYIMGMAQNVPSIFWYLKGSDSFVQYALDIADNPHPPTVNSISWGATESFMHPSTMDSFNTATLQLAAMGITVTVSSGDDGVTSDDCGCVEDSSSFYSSWLGPSWSGDGYFPSFPATSPYVTAVGGTMGPNTNQPESVCMSNLDGVITSGGGFSTYYPTPEWQLNTIAEYLNTSSNFSPPTAGYNPRGRGYPDISMVATLYPVFIAGDQYLLYGTSASSPLFASFITMVNSKRAQAIPPLPTVGWINPTLYAAGNAQYYNDVTDGINNCCIADTDAPPTCCAAGFFAQPGWDPATGWGSIQFPALQTLLTQDIGPQVPTPAPTTPSPTYTPGEPTPQPTHAPTTRAIPGPNGYILTFINVGNACVTNPLSPSNSSTATNANKLILVEGLRVGVCMVIQGNHSTTQSVINTFEYRNVFLYMTQTVYNTTDCTGEPLSVVNAGTGYNECVQVNSNTYTQSVFSDEATPWLHPTLPTGVVFLNYESSVACTGFDQVNSFEWVASDECIGSSLLLTCTTPSPATSAKSLPNTLTLNGYAITGFFEQIYFSFGGESDSSTSTTATTSSGYTTNAHTTCPGIMLEEEHFRPTLCSISDDNDEYYYYSDSSSSQDNSATRINSNTRGLQNNEDTYGGEYYYSDDGPLVEAADVTQFCLIKAAVVPPAPEPQSKPFLNNRDVAIVAISIPIIIILIIIAVCYFNPQYNPFLADIQAVNTDEVIDVGAVSEMDSESGVEMSAIHNPMEKYLLSTHANSILFATSPAYSSTLHTTDSGHDSNTHVFADAGTSMTPPVSETPPPVANNNSSSNNTSTVNAMHSSSTHTGIVSSTADSTNSTQSHIQSKPHQEVEEMEEIDMSSGTQVKEATTKPPRHKHTKSNTRVSK